MTTIAAGQAIRSTHNILTLRGVHRVLWTSEKSNEAVVIPIPMPTDKSSVRYYPAPYKIALSRITTLADEGSLIETRVSPPPIVNQDDDEIRERYPMRQSKTTRKIRTDSAPLQIRDADSELIQPILDEIAVDPVAVYSTNRISEWIKERAKQTGKGQSHIRNALHKYLALACGKNALLPALAKCGAVDKPRSQKNGKLGRGAFAARLGLVLEPGISLTLADKDHLGWGWKTFLHERQSVTDAYLLTMAVFYSDGDTIVNGRTIPLLKPGSQRPTLTQFRYWGPNGAGAKAAWELLLKPGEWEKRYRGLYGSSLDGIKAVGMIASGDSTSNDVNMVSVASRLKAVGTGTVLRLHDARSDCIVGVSFTLGKPSEMLAMLAIYNAADDHVEMCRRFNIEITPEQFPGGFYRMYHYDNGELRTEGSIKMLKNFGSNAEYVQIGRADLKPKPESGHRRFHKSLDHKIAGTTHGRRRERGEEESAISACWTYWEYMRELLLAIIHHNTVAPADHLMTIEMRRDNVANNRAAIHAWLIEHGYISYVPIDVSHLRAHVLPKIKATVHPNGIFLLRPDRGEKRELVRGARFVGRRAVQRKWFEKARKSGVWDITLRHDPNDLSKVWYIDDEGVHEFSNVSFDSVLVREGTLADLLLIQDDDALQRLLNQDEQDQSNLNFVYDRHEQNQENKKAKRDEIKAQGRKVTKSELKSGIAENRARELKEIAKQVAPGTQAPITEGNPDSDSQAVEDINESGTTASEEPDVEMDELDVALAAFRKQEST